MPHDLRRRYRPEVAGAPRREEVVHDRIELLLRRVPGLEQIVVQVDDVDRVDGGIGVRVRGQEHPPRSWVDADGLFQELDAVHLRHPVVREDHGDQIPPQLQLPQGLDGGLPGLGPHDPVVAPVPAPQIPRDGPRHPGVVIHRQNDGPSCVGGLRHDPPPCDVRAVRAARTGPLIVSSIARPRSPARRPGRSSSAITPGHYARPIPGAGSGSEAARHRRGVPRLHAPQKLSMDGKAEEIGGPGSAGRGHRDPLRHAPA